MCALFQPARHTLNIDRGTAMPRKVLITGSIHGNFDAYVKRLHSVQSKAGPFEAVFSVGNSVGQAASEAIEKFISDSQELSFPVYIFDDQGAQFIAFCATRHGHAMF